MPAILCDHCGYDLSGVPASGFIATCPECGGSTDVRSMPKPSPPWWHIAGAMAGGAATEGAIVLGVIALARGTNAVVFRDATLLGCVAAIFAGGAVSMWVTRSDRIVFARWRARGPVHVRREWFISFAEFILYCIGNTIIALPLILCGLM